MLYLYLCNLHYIFSKNFLTIKLQALYLLILNINNFWWNYLFILLVITLFFYSKKISYVYFYFILQIVSKKCIIKLIPTSLYIGYNNIHPILFYISFILGVFYWLNNKFINVDIFKIFLLSFIALSLGGLWGLGNSIWGFFWVNDKIEIVLLLYTLLLLTIAHSFNTNQNLKFYYSSIFILLLVLLSFRYGFAFTRHSFFDLKNMCNNFKYLFLITYFNIFSLKLKIYYDLLKYFFIFLAYYYFYSASKLQYNFLLYFSHVLISLIITTWLKFKVNNLTFFLNIKPSINYFLIFFKKTFLLKNLIFFKKIKLINSSYFTLYLYNFKLIKLSWLIFTSYINVFLLIIFLISIIRFIVK